MVAPFIQVQFGFAAGLNGGDRRLNNLRPTGGDNNHEQPNGPQPNHGREEEKAQEPCTSTFNGPSTSQSAQPTNNAPPTEQPVQQESGQKSQEDAVPTTSGNNGAAIEQRDKNPQESASPMSNCISAMSIFFPPACREFGKTFGTLNCNNVPVTQTAPIQNSREERKDLTKREEPGTMVPFSFSDMDIFKRIVAGNVNKRACTSDNNEPDAKKSKEGSSEPGQEPTSSMTSLGVKPSEPVGPQSNLQLSISDSLMYTDRPFQELNAMLNLNGGFLSHLFIGHREFGYVRFVGSCKFRESVDLSKIVKFEKGRATILQPNQIRLPRLMMVTLIKISRDFLADSVAEYKGRTVTNADIEIILNKWKNHMNSSDIEYNEVLQQLIFMVQI